MSGAVLYRARLLSRLEAAGGDSGQIPLFPELSEAHFAQFERYFDLLRHWNRRINLTSLPMDGLADQTLDRLFVEPLCAATFLNGQNAKTVVGRTLSGPAKTSDHEPPPSGVGLVRWADLGSGGGSPAIPLKIVCPSTHLTMVESRGRKAAFLREVVRELELPAADVESVRAEALTPTAAFDAITIRAVRLDVAFLASVRSLFNRNGRAVLFLPNSAEITCEGFELARTVEVPSTNSRIALLTLRMS